MAAPIASLHDAFDQIADPRKPRRVRHPFTSMLALTFLGLLYRQTDFASLQRWATIIGGSSRAPWALPAKSRLMPRPSAAPSARFSLEQFRDVFARWLVTLPQTALAVTASADGKTGKQGHDAQGDPVHMLNVFAHPLGLSLAQFPVTDGKPTEPQALKAGLAELLEHYPLLRLVTADALFTQRPLAQVILEADRDFLFAVKDNQPDLVEAVRASFAAAQCPDVETREKEGARSTPASSGSMRANASTTSARQPHSPALN